MESNDSNQELDINPLAQIIESYVKNRMAYNHSTKTNQKISNRNARISNVIGSTSSEAQVMEKPTIQEFVKAFDQQVKEMNKLYKINKDQF